MDLTGYEGLTWFLISNFWGGGGGGAEGEKEF